ncbi:MAG: tetratricopeptide repeat protein [Myxococcota bacterium]|nr:tetratricopeptide repeat protein [Myxococcota bacterium]
MFVNLGRWIQGGLLGLGALLSLPADAARRGDESTLKSSSTLFELEITDGDAAAGTSAQAHLSGPLGEVYFTLLNPTRPLEAVLFNDGTLLTADDESGMGRGVSLALYESNGNCRWSHTIQDLFGEELLDIPQNGSLYWWRQTPLDWRLDDEKLLIALEETRWIQVSLADGTPEVVESTFSGPNPEMLVVRAHSASTREARDLYSRALARDPSQIGGWLGLAELLQNSGQHVAAIEVLEQALSTNQIPAENSPERELYVQLYLEQARSQTTLGGISSSAGALSRALEIAPDNQAASLALAALMLEERRGPEADALLEEWIEQGETLSRSIIVGDFYAEHNAWLSARKTYLLVWTLTRDVMMGSRLVEAHRVLGEFDEAIAVRRQQIRRWEKAGSHEEFIAMAVEDIAQLKASQN